MQRPESLKELYQKYLDGLCTPQEMDQLLDAFDLQDNEELLRDWISTELRKKTGESEELALEVANNVQGRLFKKIRTNEKHLDLPSGWSKRLWTQIAAAAVLLIVGTALVYDYASDKMLFFQDVSQANYKNDIAPGTNSATLTLASGRQIRLSDAIKGKIADESGVSISKTENGQLAYSLVDGLHGDTRAGMNTLSTTKGQQYQLLLPDSTKVWLNAASTLKYPASFAGRDKRIVILSGEAYFEVAKNKKHPFVVKSTNQEVEVLGTHFNINTYLDEPVAITSLLEGSVRLTASGYDSKILKPGEQAARNAGGIVILSSHAQEAIAWKNGLFRFNNEPLESIMRKISRWYNVEVVFENTEAKHETFVGLVNRFSRVSEVLQMLELAGNVRFRIENNKIIVLK